MANARWVWSAWGCWWACKGASAAGGPFDTDEPGRGQWEGSAKEERYFYGIAKGSVCEVVSLLVMIGRRGCLTQEVYREHYGEADELAATRSTNSTRSKTRMRTFSRRVEAVSVRLHCWQAERIT